MSVKSVETIVKKAVREPGKVFRVNRDGQEVYRAHCLTGNLELFHYGTRILSVFVATPLEVLDYDGYSKTDQDAINTVFDTFCFKARCRRDKGNFRVEEWS